jgi:hypothetical protein
MQLGVLVRVSIAQEHNARVYPPEPSAESIVVHEHAFGALQHESLNTTRHYTRRRKEDLEEGVENVRYEKRERQEK